MHGVPNATTPSTVITEDWRCDYNANGPHSARGELTQSEFALQCTTTHQPQVA